MPPSVDGQVVPVAAEVRLNAESHTFKDDILAHVTYQRYRRCDVIRIVTWMPLRCDQVDPRLLCVECRCFSFAVAWTKLDHFRLLGRFVCRGLRQHDCQ